MASVAVVYLLRPARVRPVPARVVPGDAVQTDDGLIGTVLRVDGVFALVDAGDGRVAWARCAELMSADPAAAASTGPAVPGNVVKDGPEDVVADASSDAEAEAEADAESNALATPPPRVTEDAAGALPRLAEGVWRARRTIAWTWLVAVLACLPLAGTAEQAFTNGGFLIKDGEAIQVLEEVRDEFRMPIAQQVMIVPGPIATVEQQFPPMLPQLYRVPHVLVVGKPRASTDGSLVAITVYFDNTDDVAVDSYEEVIEAFESGGYQPSDIQVAGTTATFADTSIQTKRDLARAELIAMPLAVIVLLLVFGTAVAAVVPVIVGGASVVLTLAILHVLSLPLGLSIFVMNIASMLGFGLGIDYSLLGVSRFREELAAGRTPREATLVTMTTSGRATAISGVAVLAGVAALAAIPLPVMFAIALGGVVVVAVTVFASLTLLPALLALIGPGIERGRIRPSRPSSDPTGSRWYALAHLVMRRPGVSLVLGVGILLVLASPVLGAPLKVPHDEVLPRDSPSVRAKQTLDREFDERISSPAVLIVDTTDPAELAVVTRAVRGVDHVERIQVVMRDQARGRTLISVWGDEEVGTGGPVSRQQARDLRALDLPVDMLVSGQGAGEIEFLEVIRTGMPDTLLLMFASTLLVLTVAFRSITIPLKAILLDTLSILASLGVVIAVFQDGRAASLVGIEPLGYTESTIPIILFCLLFGLSMDYEVFMLAKVTELYQAGYDGSEATARGVAATAPLVTGAALILIVIGAAFTTTELVLVKQIGFGMAVALALDATVVRVLLLPATMRLLGPANWWLPAPLQRRIPRVEWAH